MVDLHAGLLTLFAIADSNTSFPEGVDLVDVAALAKCYLASLLEPLTTFELYNEIRGARSIKIVYYVDVRITMLCLCMCTRHTHYEHILLIQENRAENDQLVLLLAPHPSTVQFPQFAVQLHLALNKKPWGGMLT